VAVDGVNSAPAKAVEPIVMEGISKKKPSSVFAGLSVIVPTSGVELLSSKVPDTSNTVSACAGRTETEHSTMAAIDNEGTEKHRERDDI
jgi:hypothetical protein